MIQGILFICSILAIAFVLTGYLTSSSPSGELFFIYKPIVKIISIAITLIIFMIGIFSFLIKDQIKLDGYNKGYKDAINIKYEVITDTIYKKKYFIKHQLKLNLK